jgi:hypothetical protein
MNGHDAHAVTAMVEQIKPVLAGRQAPLQGAALADCLAIWLAGHHVEGDIDATRALRAELLALHCQSVRQLVELNARIMGTTLSVPA